MKIRQAKASDATRCAEFSCVRTAEELRELLKRGETQWLVIEDDNGVVVGLGIINFWAWNKMAWIWDLWVDKSERGKGYGSALLKGMLKATKKGGARVMMHFGPPNPHDCSLCELLVNNGFRVCGMNDRWFGDQKNPTAVFYGYDL
ncbi:MAG: GNAT family N-acetyltransferase [Planctomycetes bacterium]|nr:GNAT family N-acetyltransferase [Planctomycetota bacterium]